MRGEDLVQHRAHAVARCGLHRGVEMALQVGGECDASHARMVARSACDAKCCGGGLCLSLNFGFDCKASIVNPPHRARLAPNPAVPPISALPNCGRSHG
jgi:hypothetical protein